VAIASSAAKAVEKIDATAFDAVLADIRMPGGSGLRVLSKMTETNPEIPVIIITGYSSKDNAIDALNQGAFAYLEKPLKMDEVNHTLSKAISALEGRRERRRLISSLEEAGREAKRRAEQLEQAYEKLKTTQLQLIQSAKLPALGELAAGVAHEINNPLSAVLTYSILLQEKTQEPELLQDSLPEFQQQLELIQKAAERCKQIEDNLLAFSRETGGTMVSTNLGQIVDNTLELMRSHFQRDAVKLEQEIPPDLFVWANSSELQQVFTNLALNAKQAMQGGGTLRLKAYLENPTCVIIELSDTGVGISKAHLEKIFDPFFTTKRIGEGTGIGLSIAHGIIQKHRGTITVDSELGRGTTFRLALPVEAQSPTTAEAPTPGPADPPIPQDLVAADSPINHGNAPRLLLVDDDELVLDSVRVVLERDYQVTSTNSPAEALRILADASHDIVLVDMLMDEMHGLDLIRAAREVHPELLAIVITGSCADEARQAALNEGAFALLEKPLSPNVLRQAVVRAWQSSLSGPH